MVNKSFKNNVKLDLINSLKTFQLYYYFHRATCFPNIPNAKIEWIPNSILSYLSCSIFSPNRTALYLANSVPKEFECFDILLRYINTTHSI